MPAYKSILKPLELKTAGKARKCYHHGRKCVAKGEVCLVVREGMTERGYCRGCAHEMVKTAQSELERIMDRLSSAS